MTIRPDVAAKIQGLRKKTTKNGATEAEAFAAAAKIRELLDKYQMEASDVDLQAEGTAHLELAPTGERGGELMFAISSAVGFYTHTRIWRGGRMMHVLGLRSDADNAEWLLYSLSYHVQQSGMSWLLDQVTSPGRGALESFIAAACQRISERLRGDAPAGGGRGLVPVRDKMVDDAFDKLGLHLSSDRTALRVTNGAAVGAGRDAADRAGFGRPVDRSRQFAIGKH